MRLNHRIYDALERILLVVLYFVPYAYMALLADVRGGTVVGYILCAAIMGFIAFLAGMTPHAGAGRSFVIYAELAFDNGQI